MYIPCRWHFVIKHDLFYFILIKNHLSAWVNRLLHSEEQPDLNFTLQVWKDYEQSRDEMLTELGALSLTLKRQPQHRDQVKQRLDYNAEKVGLLHRISFQCEEGGDYIIYYKTSTFAAIIC